MIMKFTEIKYFKQTLAFLGFRKLNIDDCFLLLDSWLRDLFPVILMFNLKKIQYLKKKFLLVLNNKQ